MLTKAWKLVIFMILFVLVFSYAMFEGGFVSWFLFYSFLPFCLYGLGLSFYPLKDFQVMRQISDGPFTAGDHVKIKVTLRRNIPFPVLYVVTEEQVSEQLRRSQMKRKHLLLPSFRRRVAYELTLENIPRGEHLFSGIRLKTGDLLGLVEKEIIIPCENKMIVYPAIEQITFQTLANRSDQGALPSRERIQRDATMATGVREYQSGDRFSWINWKATAKRNHIMTKEFEQRQSPDTFIVMDRSPHAHFETIVSFTASLMNRMLENGEKVGFLSCGTNRIYFPIEGGMQQRKQILFHLSTVEADSENDLHKMLENDYIFQQQQTKLIIVVGILSKQLVHLVTMHASSRREIILCLIKNETLSKYEKAIIETANLQHVEIKVICKKATHVGFLEVYE